MINPPIALYYMQGLNTTPLHGHAALFGVYGMLGIGLMLVCLRAMEPRAAWKEGWLRFAFWAMNVGLMSMCVGSLLPVGLDADLGLGGKGLLVCPQHRVPRAAVYADAALAARAGRHDIRHCALVLVAFVFVGRSGSARRVEEPLPDAVRVPAGD